MKRCSICLVVFFLAFAVSAFAQSASANEASRIVPANCSAPETDTRHFPLQAQKLGPKWPQKLGLHLAKLGEGGWYCNSDPAKGTWKEKPEYIEKDTLVLADEMGTPRYKADCGNRIFLLPAEPPTEIRDEAVVIVEEVKREEKKPEVREASLSPPPVYELPPQSQPAREETGNQWAPTFAVGGYSTSVFPALSDNAYGRTVCMSGASVDIGVAYGKPNGSFWRFAGSIRQIQAGSSTVKDCPECGTATVAAQTGGSIFGVRAERVFRFKRDWKVQPILIAGLGYARMSGNFTGYLNGKVVPDVQPGDFLGSRNLVLAGIGVGTMTEVDHVSIGATIGIDTLGIYAGVQIVYWPRVSSR